MFYNLLCWKCIQTLDSQPHQTYFALPYHICVTVTAVLRNLFGGKIPFVTGKYHTLRECSTIRIQGIRGSLVECLLLCCPGSVWYLLYWGVAAV